MKLKETDLYNIQGGAVTASMFNAVSRLMSTVLDIGRVVGSSIRRVFTKNYC